MDRNTNFRPASLFYLPSLSARRAWIEILVSRLVEMSDAVALRKESVDRNHYVRQFTGAGRLSLSARRAWIEIGCWRDARRALGVALRKESVDRNLILLPFGALCWRRSPQGERG